MQQNSRRLERNKSSFLCPRAGCGAPLASPPRASGRRRRCFSRRFRDPPSQAGRAAGALRCRAVPGPVYLHRLLGAAGSACRACWKRPSDIWSAGPKVRRRGASAHPVSSQAAGAVRAALHYVLLGPGFFYCRICLPAQLPARSCPISPGGLGVFSCSWTGSKW